ncbi:histidinol-phosphate transaminase [Pelomicrobium sp. G1]|uniref:histidinol-phosphate transaminase n=1 Tax=unclassified Pelomicrobium TaxID=2815318 RepID=UPI003F766124
MPLKPEQLVRPEILALSAYPVPPSRGMVKLDAMENPYRLPPEVQAEVGRLAAETALNRYPDPQAPALKERLRAFFGLRADTGLMLGNGSDELIQIVALALARPGAVLLSVEPTFVMFRLIATWAGMAYEGVPLKPDFSLDLEAVLVAMERRRPALIFIAYPNNPTGNLFDRSALLRLIEAAPGLVVIDEAYHAFAEESLLDALERYEHVLVMRTLSKLGLAGLRLGALMGPPAWLEQLEKVRLPYNVGVLTQVVAESVLQRSDVLIQQAAAIRGERERLARALGQRPGVTVYPSRANFLLFRVARAREVFEGLKRQGVLIKDLSGSHRLLADCLRVTVGTPEENERFLVALDASLPAAAGIGRSPGLPDLAPIAPSKP